MHNVLNGARCHTPTVLHIDETVKRDKINDTHYVYRVSNAIHDKHIEFVKVILNVSFFNIQLDVYGPCHAKTRLRGFRPDPTQTGLNSNRRW